MNTATTPKATAKLPPFDIAFDWLMTQVDEPEEFKPSTLGRLNESKFALTKRDNPELDIANLTKDKAKKVYQSKFWDKLPCESLPTPLAIALADCAVDQGLDIGRRLLCRTLGIDPGDDMPVINEETFEHLADWSLVGRFLSLRLRRYAFTAGNHQFMEDWARRILNLQEFLIHEIGQEQDPEEKPQAQNPQALKPQTAAPTSKTTTRKAAGRKQPPKAAPQTKPKAAPGKTPAPKRAPAQKKPSKPSVVADAG